MRVVTFESVYEGVIRRHGLDPLGDAITQDTARVIAQKITRRARKALRTWNFLEWSNTEERAFRPVWNATSQFYLSNPVTGLPDEVFYIPNDSYYVVNSSSVTDPPPGTLPTDTAYFAPLTPVDTYIDLDQTCRPAIGRVLGVYPSNPRLNGCGLRGLDFRPSEKGIDVCAPGPTVFISYMLPEPHYVKRPHIPGVSYDLGDRVYQPQDGNVYRSIVAANVTTPPGGSWSLEPVLEMLSHYLEAGAYADTLRDTFTEGDQAVRLQQSQLANAEAEESLAREIDALLSQGQRYSYYKFFDRRLYGGWCASQPWTGGTVTELTDECLPDWIFPAVPSQTGDVSLFIYAPQIADETFLHTYPTTNLFVDTMIKIKNGKEFRVDVNAANTSDPGQIAPDDYDVLSNNKHFTEVM